MGRYIRSFDSPDGTAFLVLGCVMRGIDPFSVPKLVSKMAPRALEARMEEHFDERNYAVSILAPRRGEGKAG